MNLKTVGIRKPLLSQNANGHHVTDGAVFAPQQRPQAAWKPKTIPESCVMLKTVDPSSTTTSSSSGTLDTSLMPPTTADDIR